MNGRPKNQDEASSSSAGPKGPEVSRRDFLKGMGAAVAGAGALAACAPAPAPTGAPATSAPAAGAPQAWDKETDVVVVGTGIAGLPAAIEAKKAGADVFLIEANDRPGGLAFHSGGHMILGNTRIIQAEGLEDSPEAWAEDELKTGDYRGIPEIIKAYSTEGQKTLEWFESLGLVYQTEGRSNASPGHRINRSHWALGGQPNYPGGFPASGGISEITVLLREVERLGISVNVKHRMTRIYRPDPGGPVTGVEVSTPTGTINVKARKGIVLACGGWVDNELLCRCWDRRIVDAVAGAGDFFSDMHPYLRGMGDGLLAAQAVGAAVIDLSFVSYLYIRAGTYQYAVWAKPRNMESLTAGGSGVEGFRRDGWQRTIFVKGDGKRFVNEQLGDSAEKDVDYERNPFVLAFIQNNPLDKPINAWIIADAEGAVAMKWPIDMMANPDPEVTPGLVPGRVAVADTIPQLAGAMNIAASALEATVNRYNGFVDAGKDADFDKPMPFYKIATPPFYAARAAGIRHTQRNGLCINSKVQVLERSAQWDSLEAKSRDQETVIPHLYAAGEVSNALGWRRPHGTLGIYAILGRWAGQNAAAESPWT